MTPPSSASEPISLKRQFPEEEGHVHIRVVCQVHKSLVFRVKSDVPLRRLANMYFGTASSVDRTSVDLTYNGQRLNLQRTPDESSSSGFKSCEAVFGGTKVEKAFCSVECPDVQIAADKLKEKRGYVRMRSMEHSESPCCSPMLSYTGFVAP